MRTRRKEGRGGRGTGEMGNEGGMEKGRKRKQRNEERKESRISVATRMVFSFPPFLPCYLHQKQTD